jgi:predicted nucleotidyltransferase
MPTNTKQGDLAAALFGKAQREVLAFLFIRADESFYLREVVRHARVGTGAVQRELKRLTDVGILVRRVRGNQVYFQANQQCPIFPELQGLLVKTVGLADVLRAALASLAGRISVAFLYGSMAKGSARSSSDVDVLVVGDITFAEIVSALGPAQERLGRDVNPSVYPPSEFCCKLAQHHHCLTSVLSGPKVFLVGDEHALARLAESGTAGGTSHEPAQRLNTRSRAACKRSHARRLAAAEAGP